MCFSHSCMNIVTFATSDPNRFCLSEAFFSFPRRIGCSNLSLKLKNTPKISYQCKPRLTQTIWNKMKTIFFILPLLITEKLRAAEIKQCPQLLLTVNILNFMFILLHQVSWKPIRNIQTLRLF